MPEPPVMSVHLRWRCHSGAAYNPGMDDAETPTITPSGPGRPLVGEMSRSRGIAVSESFPADVPGFAESPRAAVVAAAPGGDGERDFHARIASGSGPRRSGPPG